MIYDDRCGTVADECDIINSFLISSSVNMKFFKYEDFFYQEETRRQSNILLLDFIHLARTRVISEWDDQYLFVSQHRRKSYVVCRLTSLAYLCLF